MTDKIFCAGCGKELEPDMQFCPKCGRVVTGSETEQEIKEQTEKFKFVIMESRRLWLMFFLAVYFIPVIIFSIFALIDASNISESIWVSDEFQKWIQTHGFNYTQDDIKNYITYASAMALVSGLSAAVSFFCIRIRKHWPVAVGACILAAILCFWSIFGLIVGFIVSWMIIGARDLFVDIPKDEVELD